MRSDPGDYELVAPGSLSAALTLLMQSPGEWLPIAGGTDVMVQYAAGKLVSRKLVSISSFHELRHIEVLPGEVRIGSGCTYTQIREHAILVREFPLLAQAARWTGGIANQNRGTVGGNIVNASPAADSLPALLAYDAELDLISVRGERRLPYADFHTGYKKTRLAPDELILSVSLPRRFCGYVSLARKVGARSAQAISKVSMAALAWTEDSTVKDVRIAVGSVAPVPLRLRKTEQLVNGKSVNESLISVARTTAMQEIYPIDDIRSTARYRASVMGNLVVEFLRSLAADGKKTTEILARWNQSPFDEAVSQIRSCCGSRAWAREMAARRPFKDDVHLAAASDDVWRALSPSDWMEAFRSHPRIGESISPARSSEASATWAGQEQKSAAEAGDAIKIALARANREYETKFGHIFIVCATGKSAPEMLEILTRRMNNDPETELHEAAEQQRQITQLRLKKWLQP